MAQKKQVSFMYGEVSPAYRYKSSSVAYKDGLHKLRNGFTRRGGGASNRPGFIHIATLNNDEIKPLGVRSNTRLLSLDSDRSLDDDQFIDKQLFFLFKKNQKNDIQYIYGGLANSTPITRGLTDLPIASRTVRDNLTPNDLKINAENIRFIYQSSLSNLEQGVWFSFGEGESYLFGDIRSDTTIRKESTGFPGSFTGVTSGTEYITPEIVDPYFYNEVPVGVLMYKEQNFIRGANSAYIITSVYEDGTEKLVCAMDGPISSINGPVIIELGTMLGLATNTFHDTTVSGARITYNEGLYANPAEFAHDFQFFSEAYPFFSEAARRSILYPFSNRPTDINFVDRPQYERYHFARKSGLQFNLYRGASFNDPMNLVSSYRVSEETEIPTQSNRPFDFVKTAAFEANPNIEPARGGRPVTIGTTTIDDQTIVFTRAREVITGQFDSNNAESIRTGSIILRAHDTLSSTAFQEVRSDVFRGIIAGKLLEVDFSNASEPQVRMVSTYKAFSGAITLVDHGGQGLSSKNIPDNLRLYGANNFKSPRYRDIYTRIYNITGTGDARTLGNFSETLYIPELSRSKTATIGRAAPDDSISRYGARHAILKDVSRSMIYQQRLYIAYSTQTLATEANNIRRAALDLPPLPTTFNKDYRNVVGVSKLGAENQFHYGAVFSEEDPFEFTVPFQDSGKIVAMLPTERALIFTTSAVYMLLGRGDDGIVTPTEVNPTKVYSAGCSSSVLPIQIKDKAFFLNADHSSLVSISFNKVSGRGVKISETDAFAKHFFEKSIIQMTATISFETIIWLLREDGALISMTQYEDEEDVYGFGFHQIADGYIENIAPVKLNRVYNPYKNSRIPPYETLGATIVRDGKRSFEAMAYREDDDDRGMAFLDAQVPFGNRMVQDDEGRFQYPSTVNYGSRFFGLPYTMGSIKEAILNNKVMLLPFRDNRQNYSFASSEFGAIAPIEDLSGFQEIIDNIRLKEGTRFGLTETTIELMLKQPDSQFLPDTNVLNSGFHPLINIEEDSTMEGVVNVGFVLDDITIKIQQSLTNKIAGGTAADREKNAQFNYRLFSNNFYMVVSGISTQKVRDEMVRFRRSIFGEDGYQYDHDIPDRIRVYYDEGKSIDLALIDDTPDIIRNIDSTQTVTTSDGNTEYIRPITDFEGRRVLSGDRQIHFVNSYKYTILGRNDLPEELNNILGKTDTISDSEAKKRASNWVIMTNKIENLQHLKGKKVGVFADNEVISNPITRSELKRQNILEVDNKGELKLPDYFANGFVGLPYEFQFETLQIDAQDEKTIISGRKLVNKAVIALHRTRGGRIGSIGDLEVNEDNDQTFPIEEKLSRRYIRKNGSYDGAVEMSMSSPWSDEGRFRVIQDEPLPISVNAVYPKGLESGD